MVQLRVTDTGVGMDADALAKIFEPYFSTKAIGTGLGLTIAKRNVEANQRDDCGDVRKGPRHQRDDDAAAELRSPRLCGRCVGNAASASVVRLPWIGRLPEARLHGSAGAPSSRR